jgi:phage tail-like protein
MSAFPNSLGSRVDPFRGFNFSVSMSDSTSALSLTFSVSGVPAVGSFSECSGLETTLEVQDYPEGGNNGLVRKFPGRVTWGNIKLRRGIALNDELWKWHFDFVEGHGRRRDGIITLMDEKQNPVKAWRFKKGLPIKWVGPSMNAGQSQVAIEELEIGHEGLKLMPPGGSPGLLGGL